MNEQEFVNEQEGFVMDKNHYDQISLHKLRNTIMTIPQLSRFELRPLYQHLPMQAL